MPYLDWVAGPISLVEALVVALIALLKPWLLPLFALSRHSLLPLFALLQHCILRPSPLGEGLGVRPISGCCLGRNYLTIKSFLAIFSPCANLVATSLR